MNEEATRYPLAIPCACGCGKSLEPFDDAGGTHADMARLTEARTAAYAEVR